MIDLSCNNVSSTSTSVNEGTLIDKSNTYTIIADINTNEFDMYVYFLKDYGEYDYYTSYHDQPVEVSTLWSEAGWSGPFTHDRVKSGTAMLGNSGPEVPYGSMLQYKAIFRNVPQTVKAIGVYATDEAGTTAGTYYWKCGKDPVKRTIRCYIDGGWKDCIIKYYDGTGWADCTPKYFDGTRWIECSF